MSDDIARKASARRPSDAGADLLYRHHERIGQHHGPQQAEAEHRAGLRISSDATWIVIGRTCDQSRPENLEQAWLARSDGWTSFRVGHGHWRTPRYERMNGRMTMR